MPLPFHVILPCIQINSLYDNRISLKQEGIYSRGRHENTYYYYHNYGHHEQYVVMLGRICHRKEKFINPTPPPDLLCPTMSAQDFGLTWSSYIPSSCCPGRPVTTERWAWRRYHARVTPLEISLTDGFLRCRGSIHINDDGVVRIL